MARIMKMAWADTVDPDNLSANTKAVTDSYVEGVPLTPPRDTKTVAFDIIVITKNATSDLTFIIYSSVDKSYWAPIAFLDTPTTVADGISTEILPHIYEIKNISDSFSRHIRLNLQNSEHLRLSLKGNVSGALVKVVATFVDDTRNE
jgi:hypothetical protein